MDDNLKHIDEYFNGKQLPEESRAFEQRINTDPVFAKDVAFYLAALKTAKDELDAEKKARFKEIHDQDSQPGASARVRSIKKLWPYIAAAAVIAGIIIGRYFFTDTISLNKQADNYIQQQFQTLSITMGSTQDSLQTGLRLFNEGKPAEALAAFEHITKTDTSSFTAKKYAGIVSLRLQLYDKALEYFTQLESYTGLYANPGSFYKALTLLKRNLPGDEQKARQLLQQVVQHDLEGKETAKQWLK